MLAQNILKFRAPGITGNTFISTNPETIVKFLSPFCQLSVQDLKFKKEKFVNEDYKSLSKCFSPWPIKLGNHQCYEYTEKDRRKRATTVFLGAWIIWEDIWARYCGFSSHLRLFVDIFLHFNLANLLYINEAFYYICGQWITFAVLILEDSILWQCVVPEIIHTPPPPVTDGNGNSEGRGDQKEAISKGLEGCLGKFFSGESEWDWWVQLIITIPSKYFPNSDRLKAHA